jgi:hydrogenase expression/formation protein HypC
VPETQVGDYVIVHVGFAISTVDEDEAQRTFEYLKEMDELSELDH